MALSLAALSRAVIAAACAFALAATTNPAAAAKRQTAAKNYKSQTHRKVAERPLRGVIHWHGGYSYRSTDTLGSYRRFIDPYSSLQSEGGPFDSGFFFDSGVSPHGGNAPYQH